MNYSYNYSLGKKIVLPRLHKASCGNITELASEICGHTLMVVETYVDWGNNGT
jgi:hypothetical protein